MIFCLNIEQLPVIFHHTESPSYKCDIFTRTVYTILFMLQQLWNQKVAHVCFQRLEHQYINIKLQLVKKLHRDTQNQSHIPRSIPLGYFPKSRSSLDKQCCVLVNLNLTWKLSFASAYDLVQRFFSLEHRNKFAGKENTVEWRFFFSCWSIDYSVKSGKNRTHLNSHL